MLCFIIDTDEFLFKENNEMNFIDIGQRRNIYADGVHDDTKAIQACLDEIKDGGMIYFPDGTYLISAALIFYSNQSLRFSKNARLLRSATSEQITKYMLASFSEPDVGGYDGTHNVEISGGIFDGNSQTDEKLTILNTVHCKNIVIKNVSFVNGSMWHYIELNSTCKATVSDCVFDGDSYVAMREDLTSELIQIDAPEITPTLTTYGPVYNCDGTHIEFLPDKTPCKDITIESNIFVCSGFTAIGHHCTYEHSDIKIYNNIFVGVSGNEKGSRGYITFMRETHDVKIKNNVFDSHSEKDSISWGIQTKNPEKYSLYAENNLFVGKFDEYFVGGITEKDNIFSSTQK